MSRTTAFGSFYVIKSLLNTQKKRINQDLMNNDKENQKWTIKK